MKLYVDDFNAETPSISAETKEELDILDNIVFSVLGGEVFEENKDDYGYTFNNKQELDQCLNALMAAGFELVEDKRVESDEGVRSMIEAGEQLYVRNT